MQSNPVNQIVTKHVNLTTIVAEYIKQGATCEIKPNEPDIIMLIKPNDRIRVINQYRGAHTGPFIRLVAQSDGEPRCLAIHAYSLLTTDNIINIVEFLLTLRSTLDFHFEFSSDDDRNYAGFGDIMRKVGARSSGVKRI